MTEKPSLIQNFHITAKVGADLRNQELRGNRLIKPTQIRLNVSNGEIRILKEKPSNVISWAHLILISIAYWSEADEIDES